MKFLACLSLMMVVIGSSLVATADDSEMGKTLYQKKMCFACHSKDGQGGAAGPSLKNLEKKKADLIAFLKTGSAKMKPLKATDEELSALADYVLSLK